MGDRVKQAQPFKNFGSFDLGGEFIHGSNTLVNKLALNNGFLILPAAQSKDEEEGEKFTTRENFTLCPANSQKLKSPEIRGKK
ncbi:unnamed protein product [Porites evermanni]|uniref:Uncharacterized protein n=1 Tax=Porites evermanni TaxID=104178 RepID=A0ABN8PW40_9CNID|nr:unnamed protein product [Porites evermanni]